MQVFVHQYDSIPSCSFVPISAGRSGQEVPLRARARVRAYSCTLSLHACDEVLATSGGRYEVVRHPLAPPSFLLYLPFCALLHRGSLALLRPVLEAIRKRKWAQLLVGVGVRLLGFGGGVRACSALAPSTQTFDAKEDSVLTPIASFGYFYEEVHNQGERKAAISIIIITAP